MTNYFDMDKYLVICRENDVDVVVRRELGQHYLDIYGSTHKRFKISRDAYESIVAQAGESKC